MNVPKEIAGRLRRVSSRQNALVKDLRKALSVSASVMHGDITAIYEVASQVIKEGKRASP